jgi:hypothetical protein
MPPPLPPPPTLAELPAPSVIPVAKQAELTCFLTPEKATVLVFLKGTSSLERGFLDQLRLETEGKVAFAVARLTTGVEPLAKQHQITETPTVLVYDRRKRLVVRTTDAAAAREAALKAATLMRIDWAEESDPRLDEARRIVGRKNVPPILRTMSLKPEYLRLIDELSKVGHFSDGFINRRQKEMIATYVSALNKCKY